MTRKPRWEFTVDSGRKIWRRDPYSIHSFFVTKTVDGWATSWGSIPKEMGFLCLIQIMDFDKRNPKAIKIGVQTELYALIKDDKQWIDVSNNPVDHQVRVSVVLKKRM